MTGGLIGAQGTAPLKDGGDAGGPAARAKFFVPPHPKTPGGAARRVGFELELGGLKLGEMAEQIRHYFGGEIQSRKPLTLEITNTGYGDFTVEMDSHMVQRAAVDLQSQGAARADKPGLMSLLGDPSRWYKRASEIMTGVAELVVPYEIVTPPLEMAAFPKLAQLVETLHELEAEGTRSSFVNAFGMHLNPEIYSEDVDEIRDVMRAFLIFYPFLVKEMGIDFSRRLLTYIDPFPTEYIRLILAKEYQVPMERFIDDYLIYNPNRNRALDYLPLFAHLRPDSLDRLSEADRKLIKPRPTFHYRLPNCEIDNPSWNVQRDWNLWVAVERLANDKTLLAEMSEDYLKFLDAPLHMIFGRDWVQHVRQRLGDKLSPGGMEGQS